MEAGSTVQATEHPGPSWAMRNRDLVVVIGVLLISAGLGFAREDFTGDGLRHLGPIFDLGHPRLGEPRWLLFPGLLFLLLRPFVVLHLVDGPEDLTRVMMLFTLVAAGVYLLSLRSCLRALGVRVERRASALALAWVAAGFFFAASDLMEPIFAAALAMAGLAHTARIQVSPSATAEDKRRGLLVGVAMIAAAALLYQGVVLAVGLLPVFVPRDVLMDRRTLWTGLALLVAVPVLTAIVLVLDGNSVRHAVERFSQGEENPLYRSFLKKSGLGAYAVAVIAGPPQGVVVLPDFHGFNGILAGLRVAGGRREAAGVALRLMVGLAVVWGVVALAVRRRDWALLGALGVLVLLPMVRHQQYGYIKYYILLPVIIAVAAGRIPPRLVVPLAILLALLNGSALARQIRGGRQLHEDRVRVYAHAQGSDCWLTTGWGPAIGLRWPGSVCAVLGKLSGGSGNDPAAVVRQAHADLTACLRECFCRSSGVYTDDMTVDGVSNLTQTGQHFQYSDIDLPGIIMPMSHAQQLAPAEAGLGPVYEYPAEDQRRLCAVVSAAGH